MIRMLVVIACLCAVPAHAAPVVAVADFDFVDSSGEPRDQVAQHDGRIAALKASIIAALGRDGKFAAAPLQCGVPVCSADSLDQDRMTAAARGQHAAYVVFGGVHKVSTLIQFGQIGVMDVQSGRSVLSRTVTFRGDDEAAWQHAASFIGEMLTTDIK